MQRTPKEFYCLRCGTKLEQRELDEVSRSVCPKCAWVHYEDPKVATGCLIFNEKHEVLLVCRSIDPVGKWVFPGGYIDRFEDPKSSARREVAEETGLEVEVGELLDIYRAPESPVLVLVYFAYVQDGSPPAKALNECRDVAYFSFDTIPWSELAFSVTEQALREGFCSREGRS